MHDLTEAEANRVFSRLSEAKITAVKERQADGKWLIQVERESTALALSVLETSRTLPQTSANAGESSSMMGSRGDQLFKIERHTAQNLEATLLKLNGVIEARVHVNLPAIDPILGQPLSNKPGSASVLLITEHGENFSQEEIAALLSGGTGIPINRVTVLISKTARLPLPIVSATKVVAIAGHQNSVVTDSAPSPEPLISRDHLELAAGMLAALGALFLGAAIRRIRTQRNLICAAAQQEG